ncbi:hypothetical protein DTO166G4_3469 [Paecilomyces variotii]|nr:hypothetical protein DTO166G4_3469 [Paecilomyces variotii]KAJ9238441.1 hypothetical protein DTO166G5_2989 [Paecilomyces variotii]
MLCVRPFLKKGTDIPSQYSWVNENGVIVSSERKLLIPEAATEEARTDLMTAAVITYRAYLQVATLQFENEYAKWKKARQDWEWTLFTNNRGKANIIWPTGTTMETAMTVERPNAFIDNEWDGYAQQQESSKKRKR